MIAQQVLFPFLGSEIGGSHVSGFTLARQLQSDGVRCRVWCDGDSLIAGEAGKAGLDVQPSGEPPSPRNNPLTDVVRLPSRLRTLRALGRRGTLIHCNDIAALQAWILPARLAGIPIVYHHRSVNRMLLPNRKLVEQADGTIVISDECRANVAFLPPARVRQIVNPFSIEREIDRHAARSDLLHEFDFPHDARLIGFVGNFWTRKRPLFFLEVAAAIARVDKRARFLVFGRDGEMTMGDLKREAERLDIGPLTAFPGFRMPGERNIAALDVMLATAVREPFGRTLVEALLVGTPYVATDDAGHRETARRWGAGVLVPETADPTSFASRVLSVLDRSEDLTLPLEQRETVAREVSPEGHAQAVTTFYDELLAADRPRFGWYR